jgi:hypothetical protein
VAYDNEPAEPDVPSADAEPDEPDVADTEVGEAEPEAMELAEPAETEPDGAEAELAAVTLDETVSADVAEADGAEDGAGRGRRPGRAVVVGLVVVVVACVVAALAWPGSEDGDDPASDRSSASSEPDSEANAAASTTSSSSGPPSDQEAAAAFLSDLEPVESERWQPAAAGDVTIGGSAYDQTVVSDPIGGCEDGSTQVISYELGGDYTRLSGMLGLADGSPPSSPVEITFDADGTEVYWRSFVEGDASRVQLDLTGVQRLTITAARVFTGDACVRAAYGDLAVT